jgi:hypothetical protein
MVESVVFGNFRAKARVLTAGCVDAGTFRFRSRHAGAFNPQFNATKGKRRAPRRGPSQSGARAFCAFSRIAKI